ncbi:MAG: hypothetical protein V1926_00135 [Candidatus Peregrinibacteria bacterium]
MMRRLFLTGILSIALMGGSVLAAPPSPTPPSGADACRAEIRKVLAREIRTYRGILFGRPAAEDAAIGEIRFDYLGQAWYKTHQNTWMKSDETDPDTMSNGSMDAASEQDSLPDRPALFPRKGILETKHVLTSDLLPLLLQSFRSLQCRMNMTCELARLSHGLKATKPPSLVTLHTEGCIEAKWQSLAACQFALKDETTDMTEISAWCQTTTQEVLAQEQEVLRFLTEYDASYRSLLQFAGIFDEFLEEYRWTVTGNIRSAASIIGWLGRTPCFLSSCEEFPTPQSSSSH